MVPSYARVVRAQRSPSVSSRQPGDAYVETQDFRIDFLLAISSIVSPRGDVEFQKEEWGLVVVSVPL